MDQQIQHTERPCTIAELIPALENKLSAISIPMEKTAEIKKYLKSENMDSHTLRSIMDIPDTEYNKSIIKLRDKFDL
jgi:hypothetical protein